MFLYLQVYDLADGALIDEDECLIGLAEFSTTNKGEHLSVRIAPSDAQLEETNHQTGIPPIVEPQTPTDRIHTSTSGPNQGMFQLAHYLILFHVLSC